jgi:hypothetical protein
VEVLIKMSIIDLPSHFAFTGATAYPEKARRKSYAGAMDEGLLWRLSQKENNFMLGGLKWG